MKLQKYLFDTDFGAPRIAVVDMAYDPAAVVEEMVDEVEPEPPPPTFSEEELALARDQAFAAGREAGLQEASRALEQMLGMTMASCTHHLHGLTVMQQNANEALTRDAVAISLAVLRKLHPELCRMFGLAEIEAAIIDSLSHLDRVARVTIKVHPDVVAAVRERSEQLVERSSFDGKLLVTADPHVALGDCRVDWGDGGAERNGARTWAEIDRVVETALGTLQALTSEA